MSKLPPVVAIIIAIALPSCQKRTLCRSKTSNGGTGYVRLYENNYSSPDAYKEAIEQLKETGYVCDDSAETFVK
jgi:hypothetical protein